MISISNRPQTILEVIKTALSIGTHTFKYALPFIGIEILVYAIGIGVAFATDPALLKVNPFDPEHSPVPRQGNYINLAFTIFSWIFYFILTAGWIFSIHQAAKNAALPFKESFQMGFKRALPYFVVSLLLAIMVAVGSILLIIPGILIAVYFGLACFIVIVYSKGIIESFRYSMQLVTGEWWRVAWLFLILFVVTTAIVGGTAFGFISLLYPGMLDPAAKTMNEPSLSNFLLLTGGLTLLSLVITQYIYSFFLSVLYDLEARKVRS